MGLTSLQCMLAMCIQDIEMYSQDEQVRHVHP